MNNFDLGPGVLILLTLLVTTIGGVLTLWVQTKRDGEKKDKALGEIHTLVNDRLSKVLSQNEEFRKVIAELLDWRNQLQGQQEATEIKAQNKIEKSS